MNTKQLLGMLMVTCGAVLTAPFSQADSDLIFDTKVGTGTYHASGYTEGSTRGVVDLKGVLMIGDPDRLSGRIDMGFMAGIRDQRASIAEWEVSAKGRYFFNKTWGIELTGFPGIVGLPGKGVEADRYLELSLIEVSVVAKMHKSKDQELLARIGINPYTKRTYESSFESSQTRSDAVLVPPGVFYEPDYAKIDGEPEYAHNSRADNTRADNSEVYFGGGTLERTVDTRYEIAERSFRLPVSIEYKYRSGDKRLVIEAVAYYTLRIGSEAVRRNNEYSDRFRGNVSYSNVAWHTCYDRYSEGAYYCDPVSYDYSGYGTVIENTSDSLGLSSRGFMGHSVGARGSVNYEVFRSDALKFFLGAQARAEYDSNVIKNPKRMDMSQVRESFRGAVLATGTIRFKAF
ncbi:MAG: hypothetical protein AB1540_00510 [Bdellovibrionota bacterium]